MHHLSDEQIWALWKMDLNTQWVYKAFLYFHSQFYMGWYKEMKNAHLPSEIYRQDFTNLPSGPTKLFL